MQAALGGLFGPASIAPDWPGGGFSFWGENPQFFGSYSVAKVGAAHLRAQPDPIGDRVFLAGEAFDPEWGTTIVGAKRSGERAAGQILAALKVKPPR